MSRIEGIKTSLSYGYFRQESICLLFLIMDMGWLILSGYFLIFSAILRLLGFDFVLTYKIFIFLLNFLQLGALIWLPKNIMNSHDAGIAAAILYAFAAYRIIDFYNRGAVGD
jgi:uncharacterized membrane protein